MKKAKKILFVYRLAGHKEFMLEYNKYKNEDCTLVVTDKIAKNVIRLIHNLKIEIYTVEELLGGKINMKFDYIIGNPPYQYPKGTASTQKKLYIDITDKVIKLLKIYGTLSFIVPKGILLDTQQNLAYKTLIKGIYEVNFDADNYFEIGTKVIQFKYTNKETNKVNIIDDNKSRIANKNEICKNDEILLYSIISKVSYKTNGKKHLKISTVRTNTTENKNLFKEKFKDAVEVICHTNNREIKYTSKDKIRNFISGNKKLLIPYQEDYRKGCEITNKILNMFFYTNKSYHNNIQINNLKKYLESPLITYCVIKFKEEVKPVAQNNFLSRLSEIDFNKSWTNKELCKEFRLTKEEIKEVDEWYQKMKK